MFEGRCVLPWTHDQVAAPLLVNVLLLVYGAYGQPLSLKFDPLLLSLIERGWVLKQQD
ncbi:hypothetical protein HaLaN_07736 [Haematococcus lacustris]|uniref:Uncharacterized protein n=1 Tax=Haematococcus lacustris TaxID=44745 RepID=A0A699YPA0_HAELA|nr:hypothetical protein HaLaN_07736 [Haematococcus lacustris]